MNGSEERAAKRVKVEDDNEAPTASSSTSTAVASTSSAAATVRSSASVKQEAAVNGSSASTSAVKKEEEKQYDDEDRLYEDYASNAEVVPPSGDLYLDTVSRRLRLCLQGLTTWLITLLKLPSMLQINRNVLDFDFERLCSVSLSNINIYACLVCGKYFQGRGKSSHAYAHSIHDDHHVFINLQTLKVS